MPWCLRSNRGPVGSGSRFCRRAFDAVPPDETRRPSVYFSLPEASEIRRSSYVFDYDAQWAGMPNFRRFDFNDCEIDATLQRTFDAVVIDPPFITRDVWEKYAKAAQSALVPNGKLVLTTVGENEAMLRAVFAEPNLAKTPFMPAMHHSALPYQYSLFVNYALDPRSKLSAWNPEVPDDFKLANSIRMPDEQDQLNDQSGGSSGGCSRPLDAPLTGTGLTFDELLARELARVPPT